MGGVVHKRGDYIGSGFGSVGGVLLFAIATGFWVWLAPFGVMTQMAVLFHTAFGLVSLVPYAIWQTSHWLTTRKAPRQVRKISGYLGFWLLLISIVAGVVITWEAGFETFVSHGWARVHLWAGVLALPFLVYHALPRNASENQSGPRALLFPFDYEPARRRMWARALGTAVGICALLVVSAELYRARSISSYLPPAVWKPSGGANPFSPSNSNTATSAPAPPEAIGNSQSCGTSGCHTAIYDEWRVSAHRWSEEDQFFQAVRTATTEAQGIESTRKCGGCHAPASMLSGYNDPRLGKDVPGYHEGDSCIVCHAVRHVDERGIGSYVLGIPKSYLYEYSDLRAAIFINHFLIRAYPTQHDRDYDLTIARQPESCAPCHKEFDKVEGYPGLLEVETQYEDWKRNEWNTNPDTADRLRCQQCHMYLQTAAGEKGDPYDLRIGLGRKYHSHRFAAANQYMPLALALSGAPLQVRDVEQWLRGDRLVPEIQQVWPRGPIVPLEIKAPARAQPGEWINLQALLTNKKAGHSFPTGPLNVVRVWIELEVRDQKGRVVFHSGDIDAKNHVEPGSYVLRPIAITEEGQVIMTPDIWHPKGPIYRPAIAPGKTEAFDYRFRIPQGVVGPLVVSGRLRYRKANQFFMDAVYPHRHREAPVTDLSNASTHIAIAHGATMHGRHALRANVGPPSAEKTGTKRGISHLYR
ncbi:MAG TPA: multiheme c-type cytochrome [Terriglobia bacterium]|nr:multiheme c-type cytochrome [Terriglobia bacterium]